MLQVLKQTDKKSSKHKDRPPTSSGLVAAAAFSLATHFRIARREEQAAKSEDGIMFGDAPGGYARATRIQDLDATVGSLASRNIREPVRSWSLHAWWLMLRGSAMSSRGGEGGGEDGGGVNVGRGSGVSKLSFKAAKATLGLVEIHLLVPSVGMPYGRGREAGGDVVASQDGFDDLVFQEKDGTVVARALRTKAVLTLARLLNMVVTGLGPQLELR